MRSYIYAAVVLVATSTSSLADLSPACKALVDTMQVNIKSMTEGSDAAVAMIGMDMSVMSNRSRFDELARQTDLGIKTHRLYISKLRALECGTEAAIQNLEKVADTMEESHREFIKNMRR